MSFTLLIVIHNHDFGYLISLIIPKLFFYALDALLELFILFGIILRKKGNDRRIILFGEYFKGCRQIRFPFGRRCFLSPFGPDRLLLGIVSDYPKVL